MTALDYEGMTTYNAQPNGEIWPDLDGNPIQAHGGGLLFHDGMCFWYGENKDAENAVNPKDNVVADRVDVIGISCYSSRDLVNWKNEGIVLGSRPDTPDHDLHPKNVLERPKVLFCARTGQFVLWAHVDSPDYKKASCGIAVSDSPTGPFIYRGSLRPFGEDSRDMTVFQDRDGSAYLLNSSEWNATLHISRLSDDYLTVADGPVRTFEGQYREAPAIFWHGDRYFLISSGCTGWNPNPAEYAIADSVAGPWQVMGDPCEGPGSDTTFRLQSTFAFVPDGSDTPILMCDRWHPKDLRNSGYAWLPLDVDGDRLTLRWQDEWRGV